jgi:hypothetical protein
VIVKTYQSFDDLPSSYLSLFEKAGLDWYDFSLPWFRNFAQTALDEGDKIRIYGVEKNSGDGTPVAALATRFKEKPSGWLSGNRLSSLSNFYTITYSPLFDSASDASAEAFAALAKGIASDSHRWDIVELRPLDPDSSVYSSLVTSLKAAGMVVQNYFCFGNWYLPTAGLSYEQYFKTLPSAMQNTIKRKIKKLNKTGQARIEIVTGAQNLETAIDAYEKIYMSSWKRPEPYPEFVAGLIRTFAERGWLRMGVVYLDDQPIASQVWIVNSGRATIYKLGQDQHYDEFSAGSILTARLMEHVLEVDRVQEVDFGSGDDPYKKNWLPQRRERWGILAMNPRSLAGLTGIIRNVGGRAAKNAWRAIQKRLQRDKTPLAESKESA